MGTALRQALRWPEARNSMLVAAVVGTALNLINQGDVLGAAGEIAWFKVGLTYCVPFCVSTYGACMAIRLRDRRAAATVREQTGER